MKANQERAVWQSRLLVVGLIGGSLILGSSQLFAETANQTDRQMLNASVSAGLTLAREEHRRFQQDFLHQAREDQGRQLASSGAAARAIVVSPEAPVLAGTTPAETATELEESADQTEAPSDSIGAPGLSGLVIYIGNR